MVGHTIDTDNMNFDEFSVENGSCTADDEIYTDKHNSVEFSVENGSCMVGDEIYSENMNFDNYRGRLSHGC